MDEQKRNNEIEEAASALIENEEADSVSLGEKREQKNRNGGNADQILVVEDGQIAEAGTHEELLKRGGLYKRFTQIREKAEGWHIDD